jgi:hypothetical protein
MTKSYWQNRLLLLEAFLCLARAVFFKRCCPSANSHFWQERLIRRSKLPHTVHLVKLRRGARKEAQGLQGQTGAPFRR